VACDPRPMLVWDLPLRLWHWALAICVLGSWITAEAGFEWTTTHFYFGYAALTLVLFRLLWALLGTTHARYSNFLASPTQVLAYLKAGASAKASVGHNPLGGWAAVVIVLIVGLQAATGLFISDDIFYAGPYNSVVTTNTADWLAGLHHRIFAGIQLLVVAHLAAVAWYTWGRQQSLIQAMVHGKKTLPADAKPQAISDSRGGRALVLLVLCAGIVAALIWFAPVPDYEFF
jgi:cytochrome b